MQMGLFNGIEKELGEITNKAIAGLDLGGISKMATKEIESALCQMQLSGDLSKILPKAGELLGDLSAKLEPKSISEEQKTSSKNTEDELSRILKNIDIFDNTGRAIEKGIEAGKKAGASSSQAAQEAFHSAHAPQSQEMQKMQETLSKFQQNLEIGIIRNISL
ncbi:MAG: hypothetical protein K2X27_11445 [Candidatus Obscuribacterales bacterium]|nr:hypothetical protein [Candidatus Obscuribacterales bacterium]